MSASMEPTRMTSKCEIKILTGGRSDFEARIGLAGQRITISSVRGGIRFVNSPNNKVAPHINAAASAGPTCAC